MSAAVILFLAAAFSLRNSGWAGNVELHAHMQIVATILAAMVGVLALVRHYSQKNNTILLLGMAFLGAAFLDGYYLVVASWTFSAYFPSTLDTLISWSWLASRFYLSLLLFLSWAVWKRGQRRGDSRLIPEKKIYLATGVLAVGVFLLFAFVPLPPAMYSGLFFTRPGELIPGALFLAAAIGYFRKESWKTDPLEFCILITALIGFVAQSFFMAFSVRPFDAMFDVAHLLKIAGYLVVLIGLMVDMFRYYRRVESSAGEIAHAKRQVEALALAAEAISRHLDLDAFLEAVSAESKKFFSPDRIGILAFNSEKEEWNWYYTWGLSRSYQEQVLKHFPSTPGKIAEERQELVFVEDALKSPLTVAIHGLLEWEGIASAAILPLRREGKVQGILVFYYNSPRIFLEEKKVLCRA